MDLLIGVQHQHAFGVIYESDRRLDDQFAAPRLVEDSALQAGAQNVQFGFRHGALQPEQKAIVEMRGIVDAVFVEDEGIGQRADLQQPVPVCIVPRQARDFQAQHDSRSPRLTSVTSR